MAKLHELNFKLPGSQLLLAVRRLKKYLLAKYFAKEVSIDIETNFEAKNIVFYKSGTEILDLE